MPADRPIATAEDADRAGFRATAAGPIAPAYEVLDRGPAAAAA